MNKTPNYSLNQWEPTDQVRRVDFNADNAKIDAAIRTVDDKVEALSGSKAEQSALEALAQRVTAQGTTLTDHAASMTRLGNCRLYTTTYTGNGEFSYSLTFPHRPAMVFIHGDYYSYSAMYGSPTGHGKTGGEGQSSQVSWSDRGMRITGSDTGFICNRSGKYYQVTALLDAEN